jgi:hypothetical protein
MSINFYNIFLNKKKQIIKRIKFKIINSKYFNKQKIRIYNFWGNATLENLWFYNSISQLVEQNPNIVNVYSCFGSREDIKWDNSRNIKIFYTGENVSHPPFQKYSDHLIDYVDLSIGFEKLDNPNYLRYPLWIWYNFKTDDSIEIIKSKIEKWENRKFDNGFYRRRFGSLIASHDRNGLRKECFDLLSKKYKVHSAGNLLNNTDELKVEFNDNKIKYLENFKFNIAFENSNHKYYTTEKIFDSITAGCLPIYWGSDLCPEPNILNQNRILFYDHNNPNLTLDQLSKLENELTLKIFYEQNIFNKDAHLEIFGIIENYNRKVKSLFKNKSNST